MSHFIPLDRGRPEIISVWMEDTVRVCLYLFLDLLPKNQTLLKDLADVYISAVTKVLLYFLIY